MLAQAALPPDAVDETDEEETAALQDILWPAATRAVVKRRWERAAAPCCLLQVAQLACGETLGLLQPYLV